MNKKHEEFENVLLKKIKEGEGTLFQIMVLSQEYDISTKNINKILEKQIINNRIIWSGRKYTMKDDIEL